MNELLHLKVALTRAADLARAGKRVFVILHDVPEVMDGVKELFVGLQDYSGSEMMMVTPPLTWCCYMNYVRSENGEYDSHATVEVMTPRTYEGVWSKRGDFDEVIHAVLPPESPIWQLGA